MSVSRIGLPGVFAIVLLLGVAGCMPFKPINMEEVPFRDRAQTQETGNVKVTAAVLSAL
ncbi:hypothetical protein ACFL4N_00940 [Thermodesulfobacteriota bacterium]